MLTHENSSLLASNIIAVTSPFEPKQGATSRNANVQARYRSNGPSPTYMESVKNSNYKLPKRSILPPTTAHRKSPDRLEKLRFNENTRLNTTTMLTNNKNSSVHQVGGLNQR